ncbi:DUF4191 domain-containing protein [Paenarthrobacter sp. Z7-10]|uniref:DUF4191 domain-containing protein n=1 Tax=Paenarthrobacter sp. Z7-10 TaxID=2787635 RepID=UPI0022A8F5AB|nr:DUF4191 domain-containing protein [Paenarthrobacter sp. Z7-10]MCZ2402384.1 DUF4191 domain-containing protein [Paenarthrobacter sp. Z7-10]
MAKSTDSANASSDPDAVKKRSPFFRRGKGSTAVGPKKQNRVKQLVDIFKMTRRHDPNAQWLMLLVFLGVIVVALGIGFLVGNWITGLILGIPLGFLGALLILSRRAERAAFAQIEGQPGAAGAAINTLRRGWIVEEQPVAVNPRSQDVIFRAIGRAGVVLVSEGPSARVKPLIDAERRRLNRILPNVTVHVLESGRGEGQVELRSLAKKMQKLKPELTKGEVSAVNKRVASLGNKLPIPKGIDPNKARPDRKAARGR